MNIMIHARGMARLKVDGRFLTEFNWQTDALQGVGGHVQVFGPGKEFLSGLGFYYKGKVEVGGGVDIKGSLPEARLAEFERWFVETRLHDSAAERELDPGRELIEEVGGAKGLLPGLSRGNLTMNYCWTTKPPLENNGSRQRYLEVYDVFLNPPALYGQLLTNLSRQAEFVLTSEEAITGDNAKLTSLIRGKVPFLPGAALAVEEEVVLG
jgi:hypothetical protein